AGCAAVQVGTASFGDPGLLGRLAAEVSRLLDAAGVAAVAEIVGTLCLPRTGAPAGETAEGEARSGRPDEAAIAAGGAPSWARRSSATRCASATTGTRS